MVKMENFPILGIQKIFALITKVTNFAFLAAFA
jgi:hypothetical protein